MYAINTHVLSNGWHGNFLVVHLNCFPTSDQQIWSYSVYIWISEVLFFLITEITMFRTFGIYLILYRTYCSSYHAFFMLMVKFYMLVCITDNGCNYQYNVLSFSIHHSHIRYMAFAPRLQQTVFKSLHTHTPPCSLHNSQTTSN